MRSLKKRSLGSSSSSSSSTDETSPPPLISVCVQVPRDLGARQVTMESQDGRGLLVFLA